jgi:hypothetical protein
MPPLGDGQVPRCLKGYATGTNVVHKVDPPQVGPRFARVPVRIVIDRQGKVKHIHVINAVPDQAASIKAALEQWVFKPYIETGQMPTFTLFGSGTLPVIQHATSPASTFAAAVGATISNPSIRPNTSPVPPVEHIDIAALGIIGTFIAFKFCIVFARANRERRQRETDAASGKILLSR